MTPPIPSPYEVISRLRVALAEMGYEEVGIYDLGRKAPEEWPIVAAPFGSLPPEVWWMACRMVYPIHPCWSCWSEARRLHTLMDWDCARGNCQSPDGPSRPPREALVAR